MEKLGASHRSTSHFREESWHTRSRPAPALPCSRAQQRVPCCFPTWSLSAFATNSMASARYDARARREVSCCSCRTWSRCSCAAPRAVVGLHEWPRSFGDGRRGRARSCLDTLQQGIEDGARRRDLTKSPWQPPSELDCVWALSETECACEPEECFHCSIPHSTNHST